MKHKDSSYCLFLVISVLCFFLAPPFSRGDAWDPADDIPPGAVRLGAPSGAEQAHGPHTLSGTDKADWFRFSLDRGETYEFFTSGFADTLGELYLADGIAMVAMNDENGPDPNFRIRYTPSEHGVFYLKVTQFRTDIEITYDLHFLNQSAAIGTDSWDPADDNLQGATNLGTPSLEAHTHGPHTLSNQDEYDWFRFVLNTGEVYEFYTSGGSDTVGDLFRSNGISRVAHTDSGGLDANFSLTFSVIDSGVYYLRVYVTDRSLGGKYTLHYRSGAEPPPPGDDWDPLDDLFDGATRIGTPSSHEGQHGPHTLSESDLFDWFQFVLQGGKTYVFATTGDSDTVGDLYGSNATTQLSTDDNGGGHNNFNIVFTPAEDGKYFLRVREFSGGKSTYLLTYRWIGEISSPVSDDWDPSDDDAEGATQLDPAASRLSSHGPHTLSKTDLYDWFRFSLEAGTTYELWTTGNADTFGTLLASDGETVLVEKDDGGTGYNVHFQFTPLISETYYLCVHLFDLGARGSYILNLLRIVDPSPLGDEWDRNDDTFTGATMIATPTLFDGVHGPHHLSQTDTADWFKVYLVAGVTYEFFSTGELDTLATLYFSNNNTKIVQKYAGATGGNFDLDITAVKSGFYYLRVEPVDNGDGIYTLHFRGETAPSDLVEPFRVYTFEDADEYTTFPGGFIGAEAGSVRRGAIPAAMGFSDGEGVAITTGPGEVFLILFPMLDVGEQSVLVRAAIRSTGPGAEVALGALDGSMDGSIATNIPLDSSGIQDHYQYRVLLFDPPGRTIRPVFQVSNINGDQPVTIYMDNLEIYLLPQNGSIPGGLLSSGGSSQESRMTTVSPITIHSLDSPGEYNEIPGGFVESPPGVLELGDIPRAIGYSDGRGVSVTSEGNQVTLLTFPELHVDAGTVLLRASVQSTGPGAAIALAAMDRAANGVISTNIPADSAGFQSGYERMVLLFQPGTDSVIPLFQVAHHEGQPKISVFMDSLEVFSLPSNGSIPVKLLLGD